jgi:hypothetical protein
MQCTDIPALLVRRSQIGLEVLGASFSVRSQQWADERLKSINSICHIPALTQSCGNVPQIKRSFTLVRQNPKAIKVVWTFHFPLVNDEQTEILKLHKIKCTSSFCMLSCLICHVTWSKTDAALFKLIKTKVEGCKLYEMRSLILMYVYSTSFMKPGFRYQPINAIRIT